MNLHLLTGNPVHEMTMSSTSNEQFVVSIRRRFHLFLITGQKQLNLLQVSTIEQVVVVVVVGGGVVVVDFDNIVFDCCCLSMMTMNHVDIPVSCTDLENCGA
jgi:hypothetical protein